MIHCFYHNDMDGHCAAAIVKMAHPDAVLTEINYGYDENLIGDTVDGGDTVIIVDFTLEPEDFQDLLCYAKEIIWIDHHASSIKDYEDTFFLGGKENGVAIEGWDKVKGIQDTTKAGAQLTWEYFNEGKPLPKAVYYVSAWDIWDHTDPNTIPFNRGLQLTESTDPAHPAAMEMWHHVIEDSREGANRKWNAFDQVMSVGVIGEAMKATYDKYIGGLAYFVGDWNGKRTVALNSRCYDSYVIWDHMDKWEELDPEVFIWYYQLPNGKWRNRIRAYPGEETNVAEIAKLYGGGGHELSAGFQTKEPAIHPDGKSLEEWKLEFDCAKQMEEDNDGK